VAKHFNADFYITCATVIPVLFIALVVQGGTYEDMLRTALEAAHRRPGRSRDAAAHQLLPSVAYLSLMAGVLGEVFALIALFNGTATGFEDRLVVLLMTIFLVIAVAAGPAWRWMRVQDTVDRLERERARVEREHPAASPRHKV
jgi:hypothetical protein